MSDVKKIDHVLRGVINAVKAFGIIEEGLIGQQILLLGDTFYGYRFTAKEFTAVWSVSDQMLNVFDKDGKRLGCSVLDSPNDRTKITEIQTQDTNSNDRIAA
ncbi:MAG: hypothetical protein LBJ00_07645 [Planctomycetaceae bacterium]|jgi:hypothetical protein|nr:hypothetical protein [Planctomycetaceae bacterium]